MDKETAKRISPLATQSNARLFEVYVQYRIDHLRKQLESSSDFNEVLKVQGQIKEVRRLLTLKEEVEKERAT